MIWRPDDLTFELIIDDTDDPIATIEAATPTGRILMMGEVMLVDRTVVVREAHIQSEAGRAALGHANLLALAQAFLERFGYDALEVQGAVRTSGARPGRRPRRFRFTRRHSPGAER